MTKVKLEMYEIEVAASVGSRRQRSAILRASKPRFHEQYPGQLHENHIRSAMAEMAVAKHLNVYWGGHYDTYQNIPDVDQYEVRYSMRKDLKVKDSDQGKVISVTGQPPVLAIVGWCQADDAKQERYKRTFHGGPPAYFVPHDDPLLVPIDFIKDDPRDQGLSPEMAAAKKLGYI